MIAWLIRRLRSWFVVPERCPECGRPDAIHYVPPTDARPGYYACTQRLVFRTEVEIERRHAAGHVPFGCPYPDHRADRCATYREAVRPWVVAR